jgi:hypothetical protein
MTQPRTWGHTPIAEMHFGLITQESHGFRRVECHYKPVTIQPNNMAAAAKKEAE